MHILSHIPKSRNYLLEIFYAVYLKNERRALMSIEFYFDMILILCCCTAINVIAVLWAMVKIDRVRDLVEEVLRWL